MTNTNFLADSVEIHNLRKARTNTRADRNNGRGQKEEDEYDVNHTGERRPQVTQC